MGKVTSLYGKTTGKIGSIVFATSGGETIAREYNPHVANPSTEAQVNQRARMKLMSQVSAALSPVIIMQKSGLVSVRNQFVKRNFPYSNAVDGTAQISYENIQLTQGNASLPQLVFSNPGGQQSASLALAESADAAISRVCYIIYKKTQEAKLQFVESHIVEEAGDDGTFKWILNRTMNDNYVFYAYGMKDLSAKASAEYASYNVTTANDLAKLVAVRRISAEDYQFTETRGATANNGTPIEPVPEGKVRVYVTALGPGTVTGDGLYDVGEQVTLTATPNPQCEFVRWYDNRNNQVLSTNTTLVVTANQTIDVVGEFQSESI
jgi:hypothetical protein